MSLPQAPKPAKLIIGLIMQDRTFIEPLTLELCASYGPLDLVSAWMPFDTQPTMSLKWARTLSDECWHLKT